MSLSVDEYWQGQLAALQKRSVQVTRESGASFQSLSNPRKGIIDARVWFDDDAFLDVYEHIEIDLSGTPHRTRYSYQLWVDGGNVLRNDFAPDIEDESLRHHVNVRQGKQLHIPSERVALVSVVEDCWGLIHEIRYGWLSN